MKAIRIHRHGNPEVLGLEELPLPEPGPGEVRVKIEAAGVNFIDIYQRTGLYSVGLPFTPGLEAAGTVDALGPPVAAQAGTQAGARAGSPAGTTKAPNETGPADLKPGDRVAYTRQAGSYAEYALVAAEKLVRLPEGLNARLGAAVMLQGMTAHYLSHSTYPLGPEDTCLIHAASGGVGHLLVQLAKRRRARVIALVSTEEKARLAREAGADEVIITSQKDFEEETRGLAGNRGVTVVYDSVGKATFEKSLNCLRPRGYMVLYGQSSGPVPPQELQILNKKGSLFLTRPSLGHYLLNREELLQRSGDLFGWIAAGQLKVRIDKDFPLAQAAEAHRYLEARRTKGKVLLLP